MQPAVNPINKIIRKHEETAVLEQKITTTEGSKRTMEH
jgi:hypothetical protein